MPKLIDLTGQKFGYLTVIQRDTTKTKYVYWKCKCQCGNFHSVRAGNLISGEVKSCGCLRRKTARQNTYKDLTGKKFGKLTVIKEIKRPEKYKSTDAFWLCQCECGNTCNVSAHNLKTGGVTSCGCIVSKGQQKIQSILEKNNINFITQATFDTCIFPETKRKARFDFYVENKYLIEYDGVQHFKCTAGWNTKENFKAIKERDKIKNQWCKNNNIPLIRIPYTHFDEITIDDLKLETSIFQIK